MKRASELALRLDSFSAVGAVGWFVSEVGALKESPLGFMIWHDRCRGLRQGLWLRDVLLCRFGHRRYHLGHGFAWILMVSLHFQGFTVERLVCLKQV